MAETLGIQPLQDVRGMFDRVSEILSGIDPESDHPRDVSDALAYVGTVLTMASASFPTPTSDALEKAMSRFFREFGSRIPWVRSGDSSYSRAVAFGDGKELTLRVSGNGSLWTWAVDYDDSSVRCGIRSEARQAMDAADRVANDLVAECRTGGLS